LARYGQEYKDRAVARLLPPEGAPINDVAAELGVGVGTLERWRSEALSQPSREGVWTAAARFNAVLTTAAMNEASRSAWCRSNGAYQQDLASWCATATASRDGPEVPRTRAQEAKQNRRKGASADDAHRNRSRPGMRVRAIAWRHLRRVISAKKRPA